MIYKSNCCVGAFSAGVAHAEVGKDGGEVDKVLLGESALHEHYLAHLLDELQLVAQWLVVGGKSHLCTFANRCKLKVLPHR